MAVFDILEKSRAEYRKRSGRNWFFDFFWYSSSYDYRILRFLACIPLGLGISWLIYEFVIRRLGIAEWNPAYATIFQCCLIGTVVVVFCWSPVFRCTCCLAVLGVCTKHGQGLLTMFVMSNLAQGPLNNMVNNFGKTTDSVLCHIELAGQISAKRIQLKIEPITELVVDFAAGSAESKRVINYLNNVFGPFDSETQQSLEDMDLKRNLKRFRELYKEEIKNKTKNAKRSVADPMAKPMYKQMKSKFAQEFTKKLELRCDDIFEAAYLTCYDNAGDVQGECNKIIGWFLGLFICNEYTVDNYCAPLKEKKTKAEMCNDDAMKKSVLTPDVDKLMLDSMNVTAELEAEMAMNVHFHLVQQPRIVNLRSVRDIRMKMNLRLGWFKSVIRIIASIFRTLLVIVVYRVFLDAFNYTNSYLTDAVFNNYFLTNYFWQLDDRRKTKGWPRLEKLRKWEMRKNNLRSPFSLPSRDELAAMIRPLAKWALLLIVCIIVIVQDWSFYGLLTTVTEYGATAGNSTGVHEVSLQVHGTGFMAKMVKSIMMEFNVSKSLDQLFDNSHCLIDPTPPDWTFNGLSIFLPLGIMLVMQVFLSFAIMRMRLFWIAGFIFRRRHKARVLYLYNFLLHGRAEYEQLARARIRYKVRKRLLRQTTKAARRWFSAGFFSKLLAKVGLKKEKCLLCGDKVKLTKIVFCPTGRCHMPYCSFCWNDMHKTCYACLATKGRVTTAYSQVQETPT